MWMWTLNFLRNETRNLINEYFKILLKNNLYASVHDFNCLTIRNIYFIKSHMYYLNPIYWVFFIFYSFQIYFLIFFSFQNNRIHLKSRVALALQWYSLLYLGLRGYCYPSDLSNSTRWNWVISTKFTQIKFSQNYDEYNFKMEMKKETQIDLINSYQRKLITNQLNNQIRKYKSRVRKGCTRIYTSSTIICDLYPVFKSCLKVFSLSDLRLQCNNHFIFPVRWVGNKFFIS